ncbi:Histidine phosphatase superfamily, clade-2-containing protein [Strongyloides ratti]|uniref:Histidine phosphatase superfamily, clade-2-containing protein n=1 Tax=Strongyloides ratti TaxID=34506 RepID=A0A090LMN6_STRRB|nr:Histidine phosphatase superfamily, clade-2-containing protein [Strongyloides ratti]CEF71105.1 Histidine phosphatase superfamily, clade-2-containing protein [Strongyloides ratti]
MEWKLYYTLYLLIIKIFYIEAAKKETLIFVTSVWRHGDRSPTKLIYKNDIHTEDTWENGWGQLTEKGKTQLMHLGQWFKKRYVNTFVNETYKSKEVYIMSSDSERALTSAQAFAFGMYPKLENVFSELPAQVVPIHAPSYESNDPLLKGYKYKCPCYDKKLKRINNDLYNNLKTKYSDVFPFLKTVTNSKDDLPLKKVGDICNVETEIAYNMVQPDWMFQTWNQYKNKTTFDIVCEIKDNFRLSDFKNLELGKLRGGLLLNVWLKNMKQIIENPNEPHKKMILYSAHAETLLPLMSSLRMHPNEFVPYATALVLELYKYKDEHFVRLFYKVNSHSVKYLEIPKCKSLCRFSTFYKLYYDKSYSSVELLNKECYSESCN